MFYLTSSVPLLKPIKYTVSPFPFASSLSQVGKDRAPLPSWVIITILIYWVSVCQSYVAEAQGQPDISVCYTASRSCSVVGHGSATTAPGEGGEVYLNPVLRSVWNQNSNVFTWKTAFIEYGQSVIYMEIQTFRASWYITYRIQLFPPTLLQTQDGE